MTDKNERDGAPGDPIAARTPASELLRQFLLDLAQLNGQLARHTESLTAGFDRSSAHWKVLTAAGCDVRTVPQIARRMGMTRQGVQRTANRLVDEGLARFTDNPHHRGSPILELTETGREIDDAICSAHAEWSNRIAARLDPGKLEAAIDTLRTLSTLVDQDLPSRRK